MRMNTTFFKKYRTPLIFLVISLAAITFSGVVFFGAAEYKNNNALSYRVASLENQISKAKLIEIGLKISMALNPKLRIMRIKDGSLFDSEMLEIVRNACKRNDYQLLLEKVTDDSEIGFVLEEGASK